LSRPDQDLLDAADSGDAAKVQLALDHGANLEAKSDEGTALVHAAWRNHLEVVKLLLDAGAKPTTEALVTVAQQGNRDAAKLLLDKGADLYLASSQLQQDLVSDASIAWGLDKLKRDMAALTVLGVRPNLNTRNEEGETPLMEAVWNMTADVRMERMQFILDNGADINAVDRNGRTVLMIASLNGNVDIAGMLLNRGADVNVRDNQGLTALMLVLSFAANVNDERHLNIIRALIDHQTNLNFANVRNLTALDLAVINDTKGTTVQMLRRAGGKCNQMCQ